MSISPHQFEISSVNDLKTSFLFEDIKTKGAKHKQKIIYLLKGKGVDLFPILMENARWSLKYKPVDKNDAKIAKSLLDGGTEKMKLIMEELKRTHHCGKEMR